MKTYKDLQFKAHRSQSSIFGQFKEQARMDFANGYGVSVVNGEGAYCDEGQYEVAILYDGLLAYDTPITNDVIGYCTVRKVTNIMKRVQALKEKT